MFPGSTGTSVMAAVQGDEPGGQPTRYPGALNNEFQLRKRDSFVIFWRDGQMDLR
jgi:hypothetical protein